MKIVLRQISLQLGSFHLEIDCIFSGHAIGIYGPSGAGKTSLLEMIAGLKKPSTGFIRIGETILADSSQKLHTPAQHRQIGYVPQDLALFPHLNVRQNLAYGRKTDTATRSALPWEHVIEILEIGQLLDRGIESLSGGEKQRVAFARALMASPRLLLMDEPLASLDQALKEKILGYLAKIRDEFSIPMIYVSHDAREIAALCDEAIQIGQGKVLAQGKPAEVLPL